MIARVNVPTEDETQKLLARARGGDVSARNEIVERTMPFILMYARRNSAYRGCGWKLSEDDLVQAGALGMMHAIKKYDPAKAKGRFITYSALWLRAYMNVAIRDATMLKIPDSTMHCVAVGRAVHARTLAAVAGFSPIGRLGDHDCAGSPECAPDGECMAAEYAAMLADGRKPVYDMESRTWSLELDEHTTITIKTALEHKRLISWIKSNKDKVYEK